jgi:hypothetical protein
MVVLRVERSLDSIRYNSRWIVATHPETCQWSLADYVFDNDVHRAVKRVPRNRAAQFATIVYVMRHQSRYSTTFTTSAACSYLGFGRDPCTVIQPGEK